MPAERTNGPLCTHTLAVIVGLIAGLMLGWFGAEHRQAASRIQWPEPPVPHPRTLSP